jgi:hypothetical protein
LRGLLAGLVVEVEVEEVVVMMRNISSCYVGMAEKPVEMQ